MKRLGKFSGKIYEYDEIKTIEECCLCITDEQANDEEFISNYRSKSLLDCIGCNGCPLSNK